MTDDHRQFVEDVLSLLDDSTIVMPITRANDVLSLRYRGQEWLHEADREKELALGAEIERILSPAPKVEDTPPAEDPILVAVPDMERIYPNSDEISLALLTEQSRIIEEQRAALRKVPIRPQIPQPSAEEARVWWEELLKHYRGENE